MTVTFQLIEISMKILGKLTCGPGISGVSRESVRTELYNCDGTRQKQQSIEQKRIHHSLSDFHGVN